MNKHSARWRVERIPAHGPVRVAATAEDARERVVSLLLEDLLVDLIWGEDTQRETHDVSSRYAGALAAAPTMDVPGVLSVTVSGRTVQYHIHRG